MPRYALHRIEPYSRRAERLEARDLKEAIRFARDLASDLIANAVREGDEEITFSFRLDDGAGAQLAIISLILHTSVALRMGTEA